MNIPAELRERARWICWRYAETNGEITKRPVSALTGNGLGWQQPPAWTTFDAACATWRASATNGTQLAGVALVLDGSDNLAGIDIDDCRDPDTGAIQHDALEMVNLLDTYTEITPSGRGLRMFLFGQKPPGAMCKLGHVEAYERGRWLTLTGDSLPGSKDTIECRGPELAEFCARWLTKPRMPEEDGWSSAERRAEPRGDHSIVDRARDYLSRIPGAISGQGGHTHTYTTALKVVRGFALAEPDGMTVLMEWNRTCRPPWSESEIRHKVREALKASGPWGGLLTNNSTHRAASEETSTEPDVFPIEDWRTVPDPAPWLVDDFIPEGSCVVIGGEPKTCKTYLALHALLCLATGRRVLDKFPVRQTGRGLIFSPEGGRGSIRRRLHKLARGMMLDENQMQQALDGIGILPMPMDLTKDEITNRLRRTIEYFQADFVLLDPLISLHRGLKENDAEFHILLSAIRSLLGATPRLSIVVIHHTAKDNQKSQIYTLRGSSAISGWLDGQILVRKSSEDKDSPRRVDIIHRDEESPDPVGFTFHSQRTGWDDVGSATLEMCEPPEIGKTGTPVQRPGPKLDPDDLLKVGRFVRENSGQFTRRGAAESIEMNHQRFTRYYNQLAREKKVRLDSKSRMMWLDGLG